MLWKTLFLIYFLHMQNYFYFTPFFYLVLTPPHEIMHLSYGFEFKDYIIFIYLSKIHTNPSTNVSSSTPNIILLLKINRVCRKSKSLLFNPVYNLCINFDTFQTKTYLMSSFCSFKSLIEFFYNI